MKIDLDEIERKARNATPGPWTTTKPPKQDGWQLGVVIGATMAGKVYAQPPGGQMPLADLEHIAAASPPADLEHIAAASPPVVLALITRIRELDEALVMAADCLGARHNPTTRAQFARSLWETIAKGAVLP